MYGPWLIDVIIEFADERRAIAFERLIVVVREQLLD